MKQEHSLNLKSFFNRINNLNYFITKVDTPYTPENFPDTYPIGRDTDIICDNNSFKKLNNIASEFLFEQNKFKTRIILDNPFHCRYRFEVEDYFEREISFPYDKLINGRPLTKLHYQLDICAGLGDNFSIVYENFINDALAKREKINGIFVASIEDEINLRIFSHLKSKKRDHHYDFILNKQKYFNKSLPYTIEFKNCINELGIA